VHLLHLEKGFFFTIKALITKPGVYVKGYLTENRSRLIKPVIFIVVTSLIYSVCSHLFHIKDEYITYINAKKNVTSEIFAWVQEHYGYGNIILGVFIALWIKLFFRKHPYNIFEILVLLCFIMGIGMLIFTISVVIQGITHYNSFQYASLLSFLYTTWAIAQFFETRKFITYFKAFSAYLLGMLTFVLAVVLTGLITELIIR
jgi:hypothetical protein